MTFQSFGMHTIDGLWIHAIVGLHIMQNMSPHFFYASDGPIYSIGIFFILGTIKQVLAFIFITSVSPNFH